MDTQSPLFNRPSALERLEGDEELLREIIGIFLEDAPRLFLALKQARTERDQKTSERQAHSLKGASANVGATALQEISLTAENSAREGRWEELESLLPEMEQRLHASLDALRKELQ
jgi:HPt (histidine-containing phosphotransfer) domain-containing protein